MCILCSKQHQVGGSHVHKNNLFLRVNLALMIFDTISFLKKCSLYENHQPLIETEIETGNKKSSVSFQTRFVHVVRFI